MKFSKIFLLFTAIGLLSACGGESEPPAEPTVVEAFMADPAAVARGEALFVGTCAGYCHSRQPGDSDAVFLFDCEWIHGGSDQEIFDTVTVGVPNTRMVGFGSNFPEGDDDLWKIIAFIRTNQQACS
ncbi:MAG: c-type cytochrome [Gammaproteobacteria bacterium]|nr:c-type cytochrome [Gammaproteobacteria bacterium]MDD9894346.1 c-type cytochrome [Gammaproteobacteria bacterium]MDD9957666.1 c-type cytochrome [Gammaproteobacteria bacterium]